MGVAPGQHLDITIETEPSLSTELQMYLRPSQQGGGKLCNPLTQICVRKENGLLHSHSSFFMSHVQSACPYFDTHTSILTSSLICFPKITQSTIYCLSHEGGGGGQKSKEATHLSYTRRGQFCIFQKKCFIMDGNCK